jgi:MFS family permease
MASIGGLALFVSQVSQTSGIAVFVDPMLDEFGWSRSTIAAAFTVTTLISAVVVIGAGRVIERFGHRVVMAVTTAVFIAALLTLGSVSGLASLFLALGLLRVSGSSVLALVARTLVAQWFARRRGRAVSVINLGKMAGVAVIPPANALLVSWTGWRDAWRINALVVAFVFFPVAVLLVRNRPEQVGQFPDGRRPEPRTTATDGEVSDEVRSWTVAEARRTRTYWLILTATAIPALVTNGLSFNQVSIFAANGLSATLAATIFTVESVVALPVTLVAGGLADRFGPRYILAVGNAALVVAMIWLTFTASVEMAIGYGVLRAVTSGTWVLASEVAWPNYFGSRYLASIVGASYASAFVGAAIGPLPFGIVYDAVGTYDPVIWSLAVLPLLTTWGALMAKPPQQTAE